MNHHEPKNLVSKDCSHSPYNHAVMCPECTADEIERLREVRHMEAAKFLSKISAYKSRIEYLEGELTEINEQNE